MGKRLFGWWFLAEDALRLLSAPRPDREQSDREVARLFRDSSLFAVGRTIRLKARRASADSRLIAPMKALGAALFPPDPVARVRGVGVITVVASVTAWVLQTLKPIPPGPWTWIAPVLAGAAGVVIALAAAPLARAIEDKAR